MSSVARCAVALQALRVRIEAAARRAGRDPREIRLLGVAKGQPAEAVAAAVHAGLRDLAENYAQEAQRRRLELERLLPAELRAELRWHFIGHLQRNKARGVALLFDSIHTLDSIELGAVLEQQAARIGRRISALIQVRLSDEASKGGVSIGDLPALLGHAREWPHLELCGLMGLPAASADPEDARPAFRHLRALRDASRTLPGGAGLRELSMGMSADFEIAIEEGSTQVRVGSALFGPRR